MTFKRLIALLLALCCIASVFPAGVTAASASENERIIHKGPVVVQVNPLYEGLIDESGFASTFRIPTVTYGNAEYISEKEAVVLIRDAMSKRETQLDFSFQTQDSDLEGYIFDLMDAAFAHTGVPNEGDYLRYTYSRYGFIYQYYVDNDIYHVSVAFEFDYYTTAEQEAKVDAAVNKVLTRLDLEDNTDYQKIMGIYEYICNNVVYDYANLNDSSYGLKYSAYAALINGTSVCQGYANLFYRLALELGLNARIIAGIGAGGPHSWNIVQLDDEYYCLDSTWDAGMFSYSWFLLSEDSFYDHYPSSDYTASAFTKKYPISDENYVVDPVNSNIEITKQPKSVTVSDGETAKVTLKALGEGLEYQWYVKDPGSDKYVKSSVTKSSYSVTMNDARNGRKVYCMITDAYGNQLKSKTVSMKMDKSLNITQQPEGVAVAAGKTAKVTIKAEGDDLKYQWYVKDPGKTAFSKSSVTKSTYSVKMTAARSGRQIYCVVTDSAGNKVKSDVVTISRITISGQPKDDTAASNKRVSATVKAVGEGLKYQWYTKDPGKTKFTKSSVKKATYGYNMTTAKSGREAYCVITDKYGNSVKTDTVVFSRLYIKTQPESVSVASGKTAKVTVKAVGEGLTYTWYVKNPGSDKYVKSSVTKSSYSITMNKSRSGRKVYCVITDKYGNTVKTETVSLKMK